MGKQNTFAKLWGCLWVILCFAVLGYAKDARVVKVGWFEKENFQEGRADGPKSGYAYEVLQSVARYANWELEYVPGTLEEHLESLRRMDGKIDILAGVPSDSALFQFLRVPHVPMLVESHFVYCRTQEMNAYVDYTSLIGKKIGVTAGSLAEQSVRKWKAMTGFDYTVVPFYDDTVANISADTLRVRAFHEGKIDLVGDLENQVFKDDGMQPVVQVSSVNKYIGISLRSIYLMPELSRAIGIIYSSSPHFFMDLEDKYYSEIATRNILPVEEKIWINNHEQLRVGYFEGYAPFSESGSDGRAKGLFQDVLEFTLKSYGIQATLTYHGYKSYRQMISDLVFGKIDLAIPIYANDYRSERYGFFQSMRVSSSPMVWAYREDSKANLLDNMESLTDEQWSKIRIAISENTPLQEAVFSDHYSKATAVRFKNWLECVKAVENGEADGTLLNVYRSMVNLHQNYTLKRKELKTMSSWSFGVSHENPELLRILDRGITLFGADNMAESLVRHTEASYAFTFWDYVQSHIQASLGVLVFLVGLILSFLLYVICQKRLQKDLNQKARFDAVTDLPNRRAFNEDFQKLLEKRLSLDLVVGVMDLDALKDTNDSLGHAAGDELIQGAGECLDLFIAPYGKVYKVGGDEFFAIFWCSEEALQELRQKLKKSFASWKGKKVESLSVSCGFASRREFQGSSLGELMRVADDRMYKEKFSHRASIRVKTKSGVFKNVAGYGKLFKNNEEKTMLDSFIAAYETQYDTLTSLPTMSYFLEMIEAPEHPIHKSGKTPVMISFNLNGMKGYNTRFGLQEGNELLIAFADILKKVYGKDSCSRFGEDRFYVVTTNTAVEENVNRVFDMMAQCNNGTSLKVRAGIYVDDSDNPSFASLAADRARTACDHNRDYASHFTYFDEKMKKSLEIRDFVIFNIDNAMALGHIHAYYQPKISTATGKLVGFEVLARWIDPVLGFISPADFIPVLEEFGLTYKLDMFIVEELARDYKRTFNMGFKEIPISFNLSRMDFIVGNPREEIKKLLEEHKISMKYFQVEITESCVMTDPKKMKQEIELFRSSGFEVLMDDFGSGYSSLGTLREFEFDEIKIDMSFMRNFGEKSKAIISSIVAMAKELGVRTLCEGVETQEQVDFLKEIGCECIQGWFYGKAEPLNIVIEKWLKNPDAIL